MKKIILALCVIILNISYSQPPLEDWLDITIDNIQYEPIEWRNHRNYVNYLKEESLNDVKYKKGCFWKRTSVLGGELCCPVEFEIVEEWIDIEDTRFAPNFPIDEEVWELSVDDFRAFTKLFYKNLLTKLIDMDKDFNEILEILEFDQVEIHPRILGHDHTIWRVKVRYKRAKRYSCEFYGD